MHRYSVRIAVRGHGVVSLCCGFQGVCEWLNEVGVSAGGSVGAVWVCMSDFDECAHAEQKGSHGALTIDSWVWFLCAHLSVLRWSGQMISILRCRYA